MLNAKLQVKTRFKMFYWLLELLYTGFSLNNTTKTTCFAQHFCMSQQQALNLRNEAESSIKKKHHHFTVIHRRVFKTLIIIIYNDVLCENSYMFSLKRLIIYLSQVPKYDSRSLRENCSNTELDTYLITFHAVIEKHIWILFTQWMLISANQ